MRALTNTSRFSLLMRSDFFSLLICGLTRSPTGRDTRCGVVAVCWDELRPVVRIPAAAAINTVNFKGGSRDFCYFSHLNSAENVFVTWTKIPPALIFIDSSVVAFKWFPLLRVIYHLALSLSTNASLLFYHWDLMVWLFFYELFSLWKISI